MRFLNYSVFEFTCVEWIVKMNFEILSLEKVLNFCYLLELGQVPSVKIQTDFANGTLANYLSIFCLFSQDWAHFFADNTHSTCICSMKEEGKTKSGYSNLVIKIYQNFYQKLRWGPFKRDNEDYICRELKGKYFGKGRFLRTMYTGRTIRFICKFRAKKSNVIFKKTKVRNSESR